jgi:hypothetical protein
MGTGSRFATSGKFLRRGGAFEVIEYEFNQRLAWKATSRGQVTTTWAFQPSGPSTRVTFTRMAERRGLSKLAESLDRESHGARQGVVARRHRHSAHDHREDHP